MRQEQSPDGACQPRYGGQCLPANASAMEHIGTTCRAMFARSPNHTNARRRSPIALRSLTCGPRRTNGSHQSNTFDSIYTSYVACSREVNIHHPCDCPPCDSGILPSRILSCLPVPLNEIKRQRMLLPCAGHQFVINQGTLQFASN